MITWAQSTSEIHGTGHDASGAAVPGAIVRVIQTDTGTVRAVSTDQNGSYVLTNLPIGPYQLETSKDGFTKYVQTGIVLQVSSSPTVDVTLVVGSVAEQVQVQANALMVETQTTSVGQIIQNQKILDLPLNGRVSTQTKWDQEGFAIRDPASTTYRNLRLRKLLAAAPPPPRSGGQGPRGFVGPGRGFVVPVSFI